MTATSCGREQLLGDRDPAAALEAMNEVLTLQEEHDLVLQDAFNFEYAQVAYAAGRTETAIAFVTQYLAVAGRQGEFYREALELLNSAEVGSTPIDSAIPWAGWAFRDQSYYDSFIAEPRAARTQILLGLSQDFPFQVNTGPRHAWDITLGKDQPLVGWRTQTVRPGEFFRRGRAGWGIWFPVSFHMIEDFSDDSNPIINTDMRFGTTIKAQVGLSTRADKALSFRITPFAHESTHIGDEFALTAIQDASFRRVNVSYEYFEYAVAYDTLTSRIGGGIRQVYGLDGYYSREAFGPGGPTTVALSRRDFDFWLAYERRFEKKAARDWFLSLHAEPLKPVYNYGLLHDDTPRDHTI